MKFFVIAFAILATVCGEYSNEYQIPQDAGLAVDEIAYQAPSNEYLAPEAQITSGVLADDGYRYKTVRKLRHRQRRDVSELTQYLPPAQEIAYEAPSNEYLAPISQEVQIASGVLADDGYRYKTVRKLRHRQRRDVSELTQYLPPAQEIAHEAPSNEYLAPIAPIAPEAQIASGVLADDGYRYKTVRKLRHRQRRDVSELTQYLPPAQEIAHEAPSNEYLAPIAPIAPEAQIASGVLADDGYRYKTVRKLRHRQRRDVSELTQYLPPAQEIAHEAPSNEYLAPIAPIAPEAQIASGVLADDGYRYKTVRKLRHRQRRDVSELTQYLPPAQEIAYEAPSNEYLAPIAPIASEAQISSGVLADDGYRYKTVRKLRHRQRRDVSELNQYLPPAQEIAYEAPSNEYLAPVSQEVQISSGVLADDGYRYKTVRKLRHRQRRDVSELTQYLPPTQEVSYEAPSNEYLAPIAPIASGVLADDGYRYKTVRRSRHRRDVNELASAQYLPPVQEQIPQSPVVSIAPIADIPVLNNEYLAPVEQNEKILTDDGYHYKTVRRFKIRRH